MTRYSKEAIDLLKALISTPSLSREEDKTADLIGDFLKKNGVSFQRDNNNIWAKSAHWKEGQAVVLLNSHHDTVKPAKGWIRDPFQPTIEGDLLYGLGSNDAGGPLVSLLAAFLYFYEKEIPFNLMMAATAEEEISGKKGIASILDAIGPIDLAIVGEPTSLDMAIAEKGLMVIDGIAKGKAGHAARNEGINAIYLAMDDIQWIKSYEFEKISPLLGSVKTTVSQIEAGYQHNVVPDQCRFVIDVRSTECYTNKEILEVLQQHTQSELNARSLRLSSSGIPESHPVVRAGVAMGMNTYGSPTLSDQALIPYPSLKLGCGNSARSHTADEFIKFSEIEAGIQTYIQLLNTTDWQQLRTLSKE